MKITDIKAAAAYSNSAAFASKWMPQLSSGNQALVLAFVEEFGTTHSEKATASCKSLVARYLATGKLSDGKSGASQLSYLRAFVAYCETNNLELD